MRSKQTVIKVTHEFVEDPAGVGRAYDTWAMLLARSLNFGGEGTEQQTRPAPGRRHRQGTA